MLTLSDASTITVDASLVTSGKAPSRGSSEVGRLVFAGAGLATFVGGVSMMARSDHLVFGFSLGGYSTESQRQFYGGFGLCVLGSALSASNVLMGRAR